MSNPTANDIRAAIGTLGEGDFTKSGDAKMKALNAALNDAGFSDISAKDRDEATEGFDMEAAPEGMVVVTLKGAQSSPVHIYVHGIGRFDIRVGETKKLPAEALEILERAGASFTEEKG